MSNLADKCITTHNYISSFHTSTLIYSIYHSNIALFSARELSELIFPGLFHELKTHTKYPEIFHDTISAPSSYQLPSYIRADNLTKELRETLANSLVFIHTWMSENYTEEHRQFLYFDYKTYEEFFEAILSLIIKEEIDVRTIDIALDLKDSLIRLYPYLGSYHGNLKSTVFKVQEITVAMLWIIWVYYLLSRMSLHTLDN